MDKKTIVITSREPFNTEGNSHTHYIDELKKTFHLVFVAPPKSWPYLNFRSSRVGENMTIVSYVNLFPMAFFPIFFGALNDWFTSLRLYILLKKKQFILWQFDPYYLSKINFLNVGKKIYFPLDYYGRDKRDKQFAARADLLVTVNSLFIKRGYKNFNDRILLLPHGFSDIQNISDQEQEICNEISKEFGQYFIFTGTLTQWLDYDLLAEIANEIQPYNLLVLGKVYVSEDKIDSLKKIGNLKVLGHQSYRRLKYYIAPATACLVLYNFEEEASRNPIKITDYLAQNKPVINTLRVADLQNLEGRAIFTAKTKAEFMQYVKDAKAGKLNFDLELVESWKTKNSYPKLVKRIFDSLDSI